MQGHTSLDLISSAYAEIPFQHQVQENRKGKRLAKAKWGPAGQTREQEENTQATEAGTGILGEA